MKDFRLVSVAVFLLTLISLTLLVPTGALADSAVACKDLLSLTLAPPAGATSLTIDSASLVAGTDSLPEYCQVNGHLDTEIHFLLKLPTQWNSKILMSGNGGFAGSFATLIPGLDDGLARQYAVVGTDTGHAGGVGQLLGRPDRIENYQYRAVHLVALTAKEIVQTYYGSVPRHSYFSSCSAGGGQAVLEAQKYPDDFDGIIAGAPRLPNGGFQIWNSKAAFPGGPETGVLPPDKIYLLGKVLLNKCDELDGLVDGIVDDPRVCNFSPVSDLPRCKDDVDHPSCFTPAQIEALDKIHQGPTSNGEAIGPPFLFSGVEGYAYSNGREGNGRRLQWLDFSNEVSGYPGYPQLYPDLYGIGLPSADYFLGTNYLRYLVFNDPTYLLQTFDFDNSGDVSDFTDALAPMFPSSPDLSAFRNRRGKLIMWHGWGDSRINPSGTLNFYEEGAEIMGGLDKTRNFDRLFMVPGTAHCGGGPGPWSFDPLPALEQWVEIGDAPNSIIGTNPDLRFSRPICAYPYGARLIKPSLDPSLASSFTCVEK
jgi:feruloyl esterase